MERDTHGILIIYVLFLLCTGYMNFHCIILITVRPEMFHLKKLKSSDSDSTKSYEVPAICLAQRPFAFSVC